MLFKTTFEFEIVEIYENGGVGHYCLKGKQREVMKEVEKIKMKHKDYMAVNKNVMIVWV